MRKKKADLLHRDMTLVLGPPGTGKTTELLRILDQELASGVKPEQIAFVSFTRRAANEARDRAMQQFSTYREEQFRWFRTLHSLAYQCLNLSRERVFSRKHAAELGKMLGVFIGAGDFNPEGDFDPSAGTSMGSIMLFIDNLARVKKIPLHDAWHLVGDDRVDWIELDRVIRSYDEYKKAKGILDFTDMIVQWTATGHVPSFDVVIIDEAQDLSLIQWDMVRRLVSKASRVYIAGDDDQSIYTWSGADVDTFLTLSAQQTKYLEHSFRLPRRVFNLANTIAGRIHRRYEKRWAPRDEDGRVQSIVAMEEAPLDTGQWLILVRNRYLIEPFVEHCATMGYSFSSPMMKPLDDEALRAIRLWEELRKGNKITVAQARLVYEHLRVGTGVARGQKTLPTATDDSALVSLTDLQASHGLRTTEIWHVALERIPLEQREYYIALLKRKESLRVPRIHIGTIHSVKGAEAENVLLCTDMAYRSYQGYQDDPDSEHRVFYVAVTRAKSNLFIMAPETDYGYPVLS